MHIIDGLLRILDPTVIDGVLAMIRKCKDKAEVISKLISNYNLTDIQAENIANMELYKLSSMSIDKLKEEAIKLAGEIDIETDFFKHISKIDALIIDDLELFKNRYAKIKRKTIIVDELGDLKDAIVQDTEHTLIVTKEGYIKKLEPIGSQRRNGKGVNVGKMKDGDYPVFVEELTNKDELYIFTEVGKVYKYPVRDLNESVTTTLGNYISPSINNEKISSCIRIPHDLDKSKYGILISTKLNKIKISEFSEFANIQKTGVIASKLNEGDIIIGAMLVKIKNIDKPRELIVTHTGGGSSFISSEDVPLIGRTTFGSIAMSNEIIKEGHEIASVSVRKPNDTHLLVVSRKGFGKLIEIDEFTKVKRGAKGMMCAKLKTGDSILKAVFCNKEEELTLVSNKSIIKINISDISEMKRPTYGVSLKNVAEDEELIDISII
jgi:DNA gyrase subunit A